MQLVTIPAARIATLVTTGGQMPGQRSETGLRAASVDARGRVHLDGPVQARTAATLEAALAAGRALAGTADALIGVGRLEGNAGYWYTALATLPSLGRDEHVAPQAWAELGDRDRRGNPNSDGSTLFTFAESPLVGLATADSAWVREGGDTMFTRVQK